ncbi:MAG: tRNA (guanosine(37)-N1)-methyltransferase TrmD [Chloroflexi bacterium]|nr:tRNA (guanosine(37)-N1)-methyltransferase TrmD [Chloroflexota bacterium]
MHFNIFTLFPEMFGCYFGVSILERVQAMGLVELVVHDIRDFAHDRHRVTDEPPYGGGGGMVLKPEPIFRAVEAVTGADPARRGPVILLTPQGRQFTQSVAQELAGYEQLNLIAGRYEGVDERVRAHLVTDELSIGDYVLTGGELAAMVVIDAIVRLLPGALGAEGAAESDSYATGLLEGPHYTRPAIYRGWQVPAVLRSGHAANIARWRREQALRRTWNRRPELLLTAPLDEEDRFFLGRLAEEIGGAGADSS